MVSQDNCINKMEQDCDAKEQAEGLQGKLLSGQGNL